MHPSIDNIEIDDHFEDALSAVSSDSYTTATQPDDQLANSLPPSNQSLSQTMKYALSSTSHPATTTKGPKNEPVLPVSEEFIWYINQQHRDCSLAPNCVTIRPKNSGTMVFELHMTLTTLMDRYKTPETTRELFANLMISANHDAIERLCTSHAESLEQAQGKLAAAATEYTAKYSKSREEIRQGLIHDEYCKNKALNKFELATVAKVHNRVDSRLDKEWLEHASSLSTLERSIIFHRFDTTHAKNMLEMLQLVKLIIEGSEVKSGSINAQPHGYSIFQNLHSPKAADLASPFDEFTASKFQTPNDYSHSNQSTTPFGKNQVVVLMPPVPQGIEKRDVVQADIGVGQPFGNKFDHRRSDITEPEDSSIFVSKEAYEHDQKGDRKPVVSIPANEKKKPTDTKNPFAGLDVYARELYSKSPIPEPPDPSKRVLGNVNVMKHALDQEWVVNTNGESNE